MASPRDNLKGITKAARDSEKNKRKKSLTLDEESVLYATSRQRPKRLISKDKVATLFNNLSDNLCGHSQDTIKKYLILKS
ncbi:hypothetical protein AB7179_10870, partial [Providencia manganoxydans]|uniref:hypothetical protein n=1 Tax=Providencia manganoxydans TaxID=2923283 RepID=UPI0034E43CB7